MHPRLVPRLSAPDGSALVIVLMGVTLLSVLGLAMLLLTMSETMAADNAREARTARYAAEAGLERALPDLNRIIDWDDALAGRRLSGFVDGPPGGTRALADGSVIDLERIVNLANCGQTSACSPAALQAVTEDRPWGRNNPRWRLFAYGPLSSTGSQPRYVVVMVADDPAETDDDPARDGRTAGSSGAGVVLVRAEAFGPGGSHGAIEAAVARSLRESAGDGYAGQRAPSGSPDRPSSASAVQVPGGALGRTELSLPAGGAGQ